MSAVMLVFLSEVVIGDQIFVRVSGKQKFASGTASMFYRYGVSLFKSDTHSHVYMQAPSTLTRAFAHNA